MVLASANEGKVSLMATATDGAMKKGAHAGNLVKGIAGCVGGGGGGRPNMAQAGGKNPAGIKDALEKAAEVLEGQIKYCLLYTSSRQRGSSSSARRTIAGSTAQARAVRFLRCTMTEARSTDAANRTVQ